MPAITNGSSAHKSIAAKTHELSSFLVRVLKKEDVGASWNGRLTWHDACHGLRDLNLKSEPRTLIRNVRGAEFVELENADACCGFGGTFSVKYPEISLAILDQKIDAIERAGVQAVVSGDASCLMQIGGRLSRKGSKVRVMHLAELLAQMNHLSSETFKENARAALADTHLRGALKNATSLFGERRKQAAASLPNWEELRNEARAIKDEVLLHLDRYLEEFVRNAESRGAKDSLGARRCGSKLNHLRAGR